MERFTNKLILRACLLILCITISCGGVHGDTSAGSYVPGEVIVRYADSGYGTELASIASSLNNQIGAVTILSAEDVGVPGIEVVQIPDGTSVEEAVAIYRQNQYVKFAEPNYIIEIVDPVGDYTTNQNPLIKSDYQIKEEINAPQTIPNDPMFDRQWGLLNKIVTSDLRPDIHAPEAWNVTVGSPDIVVAVIDTGVDYNHEDLRENCIDGFNFVDNNNDPSDIDGHGTHIAGIISAVTNNDIGISGISWKSKILPIKIFDSDRKTNLAIILQSIKYARESKAHIISCSWGGYSYSQAMKDAIDLTPALFVFSAGNDGYDTDRIPHYPSGYKSSNIISVGATDGFDYKTGFSNYGLNSVHLMAPGEEIFSTIPGGYEYKRGTSMAAPFVSGTAALILAQNPEFTPVQVKNLLMSTVDEKFWLSGTCVTGGRLNAYRAVSQVLPLAAKFKASATSGPIPLHVQFTDHSTGEPKSWAWSFGDGRSSAEQNPVHTYMRPGRYTVSLTVFKDDMSATTEEKDFIHVKPPFQPVYPFPDGKGGNYPLPTDPDDDGLYEDINGNGWLEYNDPKLLFDQILFAMEKQPVGQFDFDGSGFIGFGDVVKLYQMI